MNLQKLRRILLTISLVSVASCGTMVPAFPEVWQCGHSQKFGKFVCYNSKTGKRMDRSLTSPYMEGSQCLSPDDYQKSEAWVEEVIEIAKSKCR